MSNLRLNRPATLRDLIARDGGAMLGSDEPCPHCGAAPRPLEVVTPKKGWVLMFQIPPIGCCSKNPGKR